MLKNLTEKYSDKKELPYFLVGGKYGFDQEDFQDPWMRLGGCGAVTACDSCIYFDLYFGTHFYPYPLYADEESRLRRIEPTKQDYIGFSKIMKPYLRPRSMGIHTLELYMDGFRAFLEKMEQKKRSDGAYTVQGDCGERGIPAQEKSREGEGLAQNKCTNSGTGKRKLQLSGLSGHEELETAIRAVCGQIENNLPVPCLMLRHKNPIFDDFEWHWFLLTGYQVLGERFLVKAVSYGTWRWMDFAALWETGFEEKGGLVLFRFE